VAKMPMPFFSAVKQLSVFNTLERLEAAVVMEWILTDFTVILVFTFAALHMMKSLFKLAKPGNYINIYLLMIFLASLLIFENLFDGQKVIELYTLYWNNFIGLFLPLLLIVVGKLRKKL